MKFGKLTLISTAMLLVGALANAKIVLKTKNPNLQINLPGETSFCGAWKEDPEIRFKKNRVCLENSIKFGGKGSKAHDYFKFDWGLRAKFKEVRAISWQEIDQSQQGSEGIFSCKALVLPTSLNSSDGEIFFDAVCQVQVKGKKTVSIYLDENDKQWKYASFCNEFGSCFDLRKPGMVEQYKNELPSIDSIIGG